MSATERRIAILDALCRRRYDNLENLAFEFGVSKRTVEYDVNFLTLNFPVYTMQGNGGGVYVVEGYYLGRKYLKKHEAALLERLSFDASAEDAKTLKGILNSFALPDRR